MRGEGYLCSMSIIRDYTNIFVGEREKYVYINAKLLSITYSTSLTLFILHHASIYPYFHISSINDFSKKYVDGIKTINVTYFTYDHQ